MAATYPEMFSAAIVYSGTAAGCFYSQSGGTNQWNNSCANGQARGTPQVWAKVSNFTRLSEETDTNMAPDGL